jgi:hypothetical protein
VECQNKDLDAARKRCLRIQALTGKGQFRKKIDNIWKALDIADLGLTQWLTISPHYDTQFWY